MPPLETALLLVGLADRPVFLALPAEQSPSAPPDYLACGLALRTLAHIGRLKREGWELRRKRLAAGLSKGQAARVCGVSRREYGRWESGEDRAPEGMAERIGGNR